MGSCNLALARPSPKVKNACIKCWNGFRSLQNVHKNNVRRYLGLGFAYGAPNCERYR